MDAAQNFQIGCFSAVNLPPPPNSLSFLPGSPGVSFMKLMVLIIDVGGIFLNVSSVARNYTRKGAPNLELYTASARRPDKWCPNLSDYKLTCHYRTKGHFIRTHYWLIITMPG